MRDVTVSESTQAPLWLEVVQVGVTVVAAIAVIVAAGLAAYWTSRRERTGWIRERRADAYKEYYDAVISSLGSMTGTPLNDALGHPTFDGLEEARSELPKSLGRMSAAMHGLMIYGDVGTIRASGNLHGVWSGIISRAAILPGCENLPALEQYKRMIELATSAQIDLAARMRADFGTMRWWTARKVHRRPFPVAYEQLNQIDRLNELDPRATLVAWRVRPWAPGPVAEPSVHNGYVTRDYPWQSLGMVHHALIGPVAAALLKPARGPWMFAISSTVPQDRLHELELAAVRVVTRHGSSGDDPFGVNVWVPGPNGERLHIWPLTVLDGPAQSTGSL